MSPSNGADLGLAVWMRKIRLKPRGWVRGCYTVSRRNACPGNVGPHLPPAVAPHPRVPETISFVSFPMMFVVMVERRHCLSAERIAIENAL